MANRNDWCTPEWLTELIGSVDLDPCSNERSTVKTTRGYYTEADDGLEQGRRWWAEDPAGFKRLRTFINPPYSRGQVIRWVRAYSHTDFIFLLRWDPSTEWFRILMQDTKYVWFSDRRIDFQPPPGVKASSNPFPHALFFRNPPAERFHSAGEVFCRQTLMPRLPVPGSTGVPSVLTGLLPGETVA